MFDVTPITAMFIGLAALFAAVTLAERHAVGAIRLGKAIYFLLCSKKIAFATQLRLR